MYRLKQIIENAGADRYINNDLSVTGGIVYLTVDGIKFKHESHNWHQLCGITWVNLQGGVPNYESETQLDELLFETVVNEQ
jgi:hypothetical protein